MAKYSAMQSDGTVTTYINIHFGLKTGLCPLLSGKIRKKVENSATLPIKTLTICNYNNYLD